MTDIDPTLNDPGVETSTDTVESAPSKDLSKERENECLPIAREIFKRIAAKIDTLAMGSVSNDELYESYKQFFQTDVAPLLSETNPKTVDVRYIFQLALQPLDQIHTITTASVEAMEDHTVAKLLGKDDVRDIRVMDVITKKDALADEQPEK